MSIKFESAAQVDAKIARLRQILAATGIDVDTVLASNEHVEVEYEFAAESDTVRLVRRVWNKAYRRVDRYVLAETTVAAWETFTVPAAVKELVTAYGESTEINAA